MAARERETGSEALARWQTLQELQKVYPTFEPFLYDVMTDFMGFTCTWVQQDMGDYLENGPLYRMLQAQRGQAKTTITAIYAVWRLIQDPTTRVLIFSAGGKMASQISGWIIQIIMGMSILACMRPDRAHGDKTSVEGFDIHYSLKGPEKSPSVACMGIEANKQGFRADLVIADDIESSKNASTPVQRAKLEDHTKEFSSICSLGDIVYLGTPQTVDSIYNALPSRGYDIRVWTGRYPTKEEIPNYNGTLSPLLMEIMAKRPELQTGGGPLGDRGQAVDPVIVPEDILVSKEVDQGPAKFQLQFMLDTALMDVGRYPLNPDKLFFMDLRGDQAPLDLVLVKNPNLMVPVPAQYGLQLSYHMVPDAGQTFGEWQGVHMYVDPAGGGQNGDETAYAISKTIGGKIFIVATGGVPGGLHEAATDALTALAIKYKVKTVSVEQNFGNGALASIWQTPLMKACLEAGWEIGLEEVWESQQKELRIIDILEPVMGHGRLIFDEDIIEQDWEDCQKYPLQERMTFSIFYQMARLTRDAHCLIHDDRLDALAGTVRYWVQHLVRDAEVEKQANEQAKYNKMMQNPLGHNTDRSAAMFNRGSVSHSNRFSTKRMF